MNEKKIELGDVFYVFTNWGICKGKVIKIESYLVDKEGYFYDPNTGDEVPKDEDGNADVATTFPDDREDDFKLYQYKLNIDIDEDNKNLKYGFYYVEEQLYSSAQEALDSEKVRLNLK